MAVNTVMSGDTIIIEPGIYAENIVINNDNLVISPDNRILMIRLCRNPEAFEFMRTT
ncbi:hypothetical protein RG963_14155 [Methanosarcina sp. Z-7115]|uniref:Uncharacterized protein n=1 Tax=Methanosarcina baikalica TaxID=3073890 RepID=A0ABU2D4I1_9EURY|nr:hypothetical protein [Methanosarcina sp. Z-7115]MDR7666900.1 hypothetical protein [Methanosarcina sp. Z-7115]